MAFTAQSCKTTQFEDLKKEIYNWIEDGGMKK